MVERKPAFQIHQKVHPKRQRNREEKDEGLFQLVDDLVIQQICTQMIQDERYHDVSLLIQTNSRFRKACQGLLTKEHERLRNQPPTKIDKDGTLHWFDTEGRLHRDFDLPAVIYKNGSMLWYQHGQIHREHDHPAIIWDVYGGREWFYHGHRTRLFDRPAVEESDGTQIWYRNGLLDRKGNRPAVVIPKLNLNLWCKNGYIKRINDYVLPTNKKGQPLIEDQNGSHLVLNKNPTILHHGSFLSLIYDDKFEELDIAVLPSDDHFVFNVIKQESIFFSV